MKRSEVIPAVIAAITSAAAPAVIFRNNRTEAVRRQIEDQLKTAGAGLVLEIDPVAGATVQDIVKRGAFSSTSVVIMRLRLNTATAPTGITADAILDVVDSIVCALLNAGLGAAIAGPFLDELAEDTGLMAYQITATITTQASA